MPNQPFIVIPVKCSNCGAKQVVRMRARAGFSQYGPQAINCVACEREFEALIPDQILGGPFPPAELPRFDLSV